MRPDLDLPRVVCEYEDVFLDELLGLPPQRVVDFGIELHPDTSLRSVSCSDFQDALYVTQRWRFLRAESILLWVC